MNIFNSKIQGRKSFRLRDFDYAQDGLYFLTINCHNRRSLFGEIQLNKHEKFKVEMQLSDAGKIANQCCLDIPNHFPNVILHDYIIMPNHIHAIIELNNKVGVENLQPRRNEFQKIIPGSIGSIVRGFKIGVTKWMRQNTDIHDVWQRNYYEVIINNDQAYNEISMYISNNPKN